MKAFRAPQLLLVMLSSMVTLGVTQVALAPLKEKPSKILMLLPFSGSSHRNVFMPLAKMLAKRGHEVTMLSNNPPPSEVVPRLRFLEHSTPFRTGDFNMFRLSGAEGKKERLKIMPEIFGRIGRDFYSDPTAKQLWEERHTYDVFIVDGLFNEVTYPLSYGKPLIILSPGYIESSMSASMGNLLNPAYVDSFLDSYERPMSFMNRVKNVVAHIAGPMFFKGLTRGSVEKELSKVLPDMPPLIEFERHMSLNLINSHFTFGEVLPLLPNQVEVGGMHLRPAKPLPEEIKNYLDGTTPVIYFSLGSQAKSEHIDPKHMKMIVEAFSQLPYKVLWKVATPPAGLSDNVKIMKWLPQQDVLAHPNVKVFITHCGLLGTQESLYGETPLLGLPIFGDQPNNAKTIKRKSYGRYIEWSDLSTEILVKELKEVVSNPKYQEKVSAVARLFKDQLTSPTERAVYWTEYVIRHNGTKHLRSPEADLSWIEVLHLDILFCLLVVLYLIVKLLCFLWMLVSRMLVSNRNSSKQKHE